MVENAVNNNIILEKAVSLLHVSAFTILMVQRIKKFKNRNHHKYHRTGEANSAPTSIDISLQKLFMH